MASVLEADEKEGATLVRLFTDEKFDEAALLIAECPTADLHRFLSHKDDNNDNALFWALGMKCHEESLEALVRGIFATHGSSYFEQRNNRQRTALHEAAEYHDSVEFFIVVLSVVPDLVKALDDEGKTAIGIAECRRQRNDTIIAVLEEVSTDAQFIKKIHHL